MIINIKKSRIAAMLFILAVFATYCWLIVWTTKAVMEYMDKAPMMQDYESIKLNKDEKLSKLYQDKDRSENLQMKAHKPGNTSKLQPDKSPSCKKHLGPAEKRWFMARFNSKIPPTWTKDSTGLNNNVYEWWLTLQNSQGVDTKKYLQKLFNLGVPNVNPYQRVNIEESQHCRKCAVVGNSENLSNSNYGKIIDQHDFVIRINKAPTSPYEEDVGEKTTHRFMNSESTLEKLSNGESFVMTPLKPLDLKWLVSALMGEDVGGTDSDVPHRITCDVSKVIILNPTFIRYVQDRWTQHHGRYPSTGFLAVIYALHECDEVNLFGFGADKAGNWHHYWEESPSKSKRAFKSTRTHDLEWEKSILNQLQIRRIIYIYRPE